MTDKNGKTASRSHVVRVTETKAGIAVTLQNTASTAQRNLPFTFAQPFKVGAMKKEQQFSIKLADRTIIPLQTDAKAFHDDGSIRHAIFSGVVPELTTGQLANAELIADDPLLPKQSISLADFLNKKKNASIELSLDGKTYTLDLQKVMKNSEKTPWLSGNLVNEWMAADSFKDSTGKAHPHLYGRFNVRVFGDAEHVLLDTVVENNWTYQPNPQNFMYDVAIKLDGKTVFEQKDLNHTHRSRWRKTLWFGDTPSLHVGFDSKYLIDTKTVPSYDPALIGKMSDKLLNFYQDRWKEDKTVTYALTNEGKYAKLGTGNNEFTYKQYGLMGVGLANPRMANVGGRPDIGPQPRWAASYLLNQDPLTKKVAFGMSDLAASWPVHFRDKKTGRMLSLDDYPYMSTVWAEKTTRNPTTRKLERPEPCTLENKSYCISSFRPDVAHQPSFNYVPYLLSGDYYHLEELQFWTNFNPITQNPHYRGFEKGLLERNQIRGRAWSFRTLAHAAYITPDDDPFKTYFTKRLNYNIDDFLQRYITNMPNQYGAVRPGGTYPTTSPWMDDFFTWSVGAAVDLGYTKLEPLLKWKARFSVQRMGFGAEEAKSYCWILGSAYHLLVAPDKQSPMFQTIDKVYNTSNGEKFDTKGTACGSQAMADALKLKQANQMVGYDYATAGFPANMQPALATAVDSGIPGSKEAWQRFITRPVQPDYTGYPVWALVPRQTDK